MKLSITVSERGKNAKTWDLQSDLNGSATPEQFELFIKKATYTIAEEVLKDEQAKGFDKKPRVRTDNKWGKDPRSVKFIGKIEYFSRAAIDAALIDAYEMLVARSPSVTGQYKNSHYVYLNGKNIATSRGELYVWLKANAATLKSNDVVRIVNVTPYASRIEVRGSRRGTKGKNKGKNYQQYSKGKLGNGAYYLASRAINTKYKAQGNVRFEMMPNGMGGVNVPEQMGPNGYLFRNKYITDAERKRSGQRSRGGAFIKRYSGPYVFPSIKFVIAGEGLQ